MFIYVRRGDTLWYYSRLFRVPIELVVDSNPGIIPTHLTAGLKINIPGYVTESYRIGPGDTLWKIAQSRNIPLDAVLLANDHINPNSLFIGQSIFVPVRVTWSIVQGQKEYDYAALIEDLRQLHQIYPFIRRSTIGTSAMGKGIPEVRVGRGDLHVHLNGSFHANEWITTPVVMRFLNEYLLAVTNNSDIRGWLMAPFYSRTTISWVPMVNPDGVNLVIHGAPQEEPYRSTVLQINGGSTDFSKWKANIRGVDLNDQFPAMWEIEAGRREQKPSPRDYPGTAPLTEPESIAMANLTRESDFDRVLAFHTQGEVIYWGFMNHEPPLSARLATEFARVSGYEPIRTVDSYAGYKDWFIQEWKRPGFTVELGHGINPLPITQFEEMYQKSLGIFLASLYM